MGEEEPILDEAMDNLEEAAQLIRATQNRLRASSSTPTAQSFPTA